MSFITSIIFPTAFDPVAPVPGWERYDPALGSSPTGNAPDSTNPHLSGPIVPPTQTRIPPENHVIGRACDLDAHPTTTPVSRETKQEQICVNAKLSGSLRMAAKCPSGVGRIAGRIASAPGWGR